MIKDASIKCTDICLKMYVLNKHISSSERSGALLKEVYDEGVS
jgi:hypothetical protein